jgi:hypothetical protein
MDKELPDGHGVLLAMYDERAFSRDAIREFPQLVRELSAAENLLHVQVGVLGDAARDEGVRNRVKLAPKIFAFLEQALSQPRVIPEIANAISLSFVEIAELQETEAGRAVLQGMPPKLKSVLARGAA